LFLPIDRVFRIIDSGNQKPQQPSTVTTTEQKKVSFPSSTSKTTTSSTTSTTSTTSLSFTKTVDAIFIENLSFSYKLRSSSSFILHSLNLTISKNQITCIIGKSGSGKSTLASLLCGLYQPTSGKIIYGSNNVKEMIIIQGNTEEEREGEEGEQVEQKKAEKRETQRLHNMFGVVQQASSTLFSGTIADNIAYGKVINVFLVYLLVSFRLSLVPDAFVFISLMQHKKILNMLQD
jgi:ABC-type multidrug transport system fused ATPase/permease subunit